MESLKIRAYNVGFGDAFLISIPDRGKNGDTVIRTILIDVGNVLHGEGGRDEYFEPVLKDLKSSIDGQAIDLFIMTHEHLDHVQGLLYGATHLDPPIDLPVRYSWLTASSEGDSYYERFPEARRKKMAMISDYDDARRFLMALMAEGQSIPDAARTLLINNDSKSTQKCVKYLSELAQEKTSWIYRGCDLDGKHPFEEAEFEIWAPEENTADYYGHFKSQPLGVTDPKDPGEKPHLVEYAIPEGVDAASFYNLIEKRRSGYFDNLLAIDKAANNTSVVFLLKWRGWKLLFTGDAEIRSWNTMRNEKVLKPIHFLKVSHHGSATGTPSGEILEEILPNTIEDPRDRAALISSYPGTYLNVPDDAIEKMLGDKGLVVYSLHKQISPGGYLEIEFPSEGGTVSSSLSSSGHFE